MNRAATLNAIRAAGEDAKRRDPAVGGIVDEFVADIVRRLTPAVTHARTRFDAVTGIYRQPKDSASPTLQARLVSLPVVPATCGECEHAYTTGDGDVWCSKTRRCTSEPGDAPPDECPLRKGAV